MEGKSKGFRIPKKTAQLVFLEKDFAGAEVRCKLEISLAAFFSYQRDAQAVQEVAGDTGAQEALFRRFGDEMLLTWNLEDDDDQPIPATGEGMLALTPRFALRMIEAWLASVGDVASPLGGPSNNGASLVEPTITTGTLSESPLS